MSQSLAVIILAAGKGRRMKSSAPKVMHKIAGITMLEHVLSAVAKLDASKITVVISEKLTKYKIVEKYESNNIHFVVQKERNGTGSAVTCAIEDDPSILACQNIMILNGDTPLIKSDTLESMIENHIQHGFGITNLAFHAFDPTGYGRLVIYEDLVVDIVEEDDATSEQKDINICNGGSYVVSGNYLQSLVSKVTNVNQNNEYYITDIVRVASAIGIRCGFFLVDEAQAMGINNKIQLSEAEAIVQDQLRADAMSSGVTLISPETIFLSSDTKFGKDVIIHQNVVISTGVSIANRAEILPFSHIEASIIGSNVKIGPFARIREGTEIGDRSKIGNFVEVKKSIIAKESKAMHLAYIGDAVLGNGVNIGAGTVFCNYDGKKKHKSTVGDNTFIGSNASIVSPISIAKCAKIGAGSVITKNVEQNELSISRSKQVNLKNKSGITNED